MKAVALVTSLLILSTLASSQDHNERVAKRWNRFLAPSNVELPDSDSGVDVPRKYPPGSFGSSNACKIPEMLSDGDGNLQCINLPGDKIVCTHTCGFGYTHEEGIVKEMTCLLREGKWKPEFETCKPFIDCTLTLLGGASSKCTRKDFSEGTTCHVICHMSDGIHSPTEATSTCNIDGYWSPELPWCAKRGGLSLVSPPYGRKVIKF